MFVSDLIRDTLTSPAPHRTFITPEMDVIATLPTLTYLTTGKMQLWHDLGLLQHFKNLIMSLSFPIKSVKYDSMVNKEYIYIYNVCELEREYSKTGKIMPVISKWRLIINPTLKSVFSFPSWTTNQSQSSKDCILPSNGVSPASSLR